MENKTYTAAELNAFNGELERYRVKRKTTAGTVSFIDFDQYLIDRRACMRQDGGYGPAICNAPLFEELTDKWDQLRSMLNKKAYAEAKELEELAQSNA